ncbi:rhombosortase [Derxia gummosa]|uniref:Rhombosortase n=1 Tax=Derxia gummosa DSM 723 TaxID=1121388 RepID=A0A8B6X843_9BURK|nr:rhombosortase [Derxia gummosa]
MHPHPDTTASALRRASAACLFIAACVCAMAQSAGPGLRYTRSEVLHGAWWELLTASWVHLGWLHLLLNLAGLGVVLMMFARVVRPWRQLSVLAACGFLGCALLLAGAPRVGWYLGLSGALHGLFAANSVILLRLPDPARWRQVASVRSRFEHWLHGPGFGWVLLAGLAIKITTDMLLRIQGPGWIGGPVEPTGHLTGALAGLGVGWLARPRKTRRARYPATG